MQFTRLIARSAALLCVALPLAGCTASFSATLLKKESKLAAQQASDQQAVAHALICANVPVDTVESILRSNGVDGDVAHKVVALEVARPCAAQK